MSGTLSKIEALDDFDDDNVESVDAAVARVFGEKDSVDHAETQNHNAEPQTTPQRSVDPSLGEPMPKLDALPRPAPRPAGPRPNFKGIEPAREESRNNAPGSQVITQRSQPDESAKPRSTAELQRDYDEAAKRAKDKAGRLPPRLRKRKAEQDKKALGDDEGTPTSDRPSKPVREAEQSPKRPADSGSGQQATPTPQSPPAPQPELALRTGYDTKDGKPPPLPPLPKSGIDAGLENPLTMPGAGAPPPSPPPPPAGAAGGPVEDDVGPAPSAGLERSRDTALAGLKEPTDLSNCLLPLLEALNWRGDPRHIAEALPHFTNSLDITSFRNILGTLHYQSRPIKIKLRGIDTRLFPCVFLPENGDAMVLMGYEKDGLRVFDGGLNEERILPRGGKEQGTVYFFSPIDTDDLKASQGKVGWFRAVSERFRSLIYQTLGITLVLNILALVTPLFVMAVYDKVVATKSLPTLAYFAFGVSIAIGCDLILRAIRSKIMAFIGARLDNIVGIAIFHKILFLPPAFTERATIGAQVARIKDFETIRDFFTGPMALVLLELPFVLIFVTTIAILGGPVVFVTVIMMACFFILGLVIMPLLRNSVSRAARASSKKQELIVETLSGMRAVKYCGAEEKWMERFREYSADAALNSFHTAQLSALMMTLSHVLMISAGLGTIIFGVFRVINGDMTVGGLVASMILVWRVLAPLQTGFVSLTRLTQVKSSISQINNLMNIKGERDQHALVNPIKQIEGYVAFARVSIRYSPDADPALVGVSFEMEPGEVLCVVGGNGSGKSTVLKLLANMYQPQAGSIRIDNMDIRQMDTVELRHAISYVPQTIQFFYGTIAQNLRLANPTATDEDLEWACRRAAVLDDVLALEQGSGKWKRQGFEVRIGDSSSSQMPTSLLQRLNLARGYLKNTPIMLFDEPGNGLDFAGDQAFMKTVDAMRGETTILMVTHRPSHMKLADKILWLEHGNVRAFGPATEVLQQMPKDFV